MTKAQKIEIEALARAAINVLLGFNSVCMKRSVGANGPVHEFDIYEQGKIIGGVSTSPHITSNGRANTGGKDRAAAELLWLSLWQGSEQRVHVLTCPDIAQWLFKRFNGALFPFPITIYYFNCNANQLNIVGVLGEEQLRATGLPHAIGG